jgi:hypothetical protein
MFDRDSGRKERIQLTDTPMSSVMKLAEGNPGALTVLSRVLREGAEIDPDAGFGQPIFIILNFDSIGLYGPLVWQLYKDVCGERLDKTIAIVRSWQMGFLSDSQIRYACDNRGSGINVDEVCLKLKKRLPSFNFKEETDQESPLLQSYPEEPDDQ